MKDLMNKLQPLVSINLLTYNGLKFLEPCVNSVLRQSYPNIEFLIIDNNSTDGTPEKIDELLKSFSGNLKPKTHKLKANMGFAGGHNFGIKRAEGEFIICLNQDAVLTETFVERALKPFHDSEVAAVQGKVMRLKEKKGNDFELNGLIDSTGLVMLKNRRIISRGQGEKDRGQYEQAREIFGADGAVPVYRKSALEDVKIKDEYFDEDFFMYKEDVDLAWRLRLAGWKAVYEPKAVAHHFRGAGESAAKNYFAIVRERLKINPFAKYYAFKNQRLMQIKNEQPALLLKHVFHWLPKEIFSWIYIILFEYYTWRAIRDLFWQAPRAWEKRKIIMARKRASWGEMEKWFK